MPGPITSSVVPHGLDVDQDRSLGVQRGRLQADVRQFVAGEDSAAGPRRFSAVQAPWAHGVRTGWNSRVQRPVNEARSAAR